MLKAIPVLLLLFLVLTPLFGQQEQAKVSGVLASLKVGQPLSVKETGDRFSITVIEGEWKLPQSHKVVEVESDYLVVEDITGSNVVRIPLTSIKAVVHFKGFEKK